MSPVAVALVASRASHLNAKVAVSKSQPAAEHFQAALDLRLQAHELDPDHADPSWLEDALHPKMPGERSRRYHRVAGKTPEQVARDKHDELVAYFRERVADPVFGPQETLTPAQVEARVIQPRHWIARVPPDPGAPPCKPHVWTVVDDVRTCDACHAREQLVDRLQKRETEAYRQLMKECGES